MMKDLVRFFLFVAVVCCFGFNVAASSVDDEDAESMVEWSSGIWRAIPAPDTTLDLSASTEEVLYMDYDFGDTKYAYVVASGQVQPFELHEDSVFSFDVNRSESANHLEFKVVDAQSNTFRYSWYSYGPTGAWVTMQVDLDDLVYAWGSVPKEKPEEVTRIEFSITGGHAAGHLQIRNLTQEPAAGYITPKPEDMFLAGCYPRWLYNEQAFWTIAGLPNDFHEVLICEDGSIEPYKEEFSILPVLYDGTKLLTRNDAEISQSLPEGYIPIPSVEWKLPGLQLDVTLLVDGSPEHAKARVRYVITNTGKEPHAGQLMLLFEPYQVYPPWHNHGGFGPIYEAQVQPGALTINQTQTILLPEDPSQAGCAAGANQVLASVTRAATGRVPSEQIIQDNTGFGSAVLAYSYDLQPGEQREVYLVCPIPADASPCCDSDTLAMHDDYASRFDALCKFWKDKTHVVDISIAEKEITDVMYANIAYNLITQDGVAFQPGARSYDQAWMRDGSIISTALLTMGLTNEPREFLEWFAQYQFETGEIPPIVDQKAEDPVWPETRNGLIEYDSQGQFVWALLQYYLFTGDRTMLDDHFPRIVKALEFLESLRAQRTTAEYRDEDSDKRIFYGLLPESDSHEGYKMKHSYWDDFWGLRGWRDGAQIARIVDQEELVPWCNAQYEALKASTYDSIKRVMAQHQLDRIPGCAEIGDVDPPAFAGAAIYCGELENMPSDAVDNTITEFLRLFNDRLNWENEYDFSPYEIRVIPILVLRGQIAEAMHMLRTLLGFRRPPGWQHLAEVVYNPYRQKGYIGDMPHTWIGAEYILAVRYLFAYEHHNRLHLGQGIDPAWLKEGQMVSVKNMPTHYGEVSYDVSIVDGKLIVDIREQHMQAPAEGFVFYLPVSSSCEQVTVNGAAWKGFADNRVYFNALPVKIVAEMPVE